MNVLIVGAGVVGTTLAEQLSTEGHSVSVVDSSRQKVRELGDKHDLLAVHGNAGRLSVLERAGVRNAEMVIAVTNVDEVNLVVGMLAARLGVKHRIVRVRNGEYFEENGVLLPADLGIDHVINPDPAIVGALVRMIELPGSVDVADIAGGEILLVGFDIDEDSPAAGKTPAEMRDVGALDAFLILDIQRGDRVLVPKGSTRIEPGDNIHVLVAEATVPFILPMIHRHPRGTKRVIIYGASRIGVELAEAIGTRVDRVVLVEPDPDEAEETALHLKRTSVIAGDATDLAILEEAAIDSCDLFCAVSDDDQTNMLAALLAKRHGAAKCAVLVAQPEYVPVMNSLGIEIVISPRLVTVGEALMHVRAGRIHSVTRLAESRGEILEMEAQPGSPLVSAPLKDLKFPENALVGAVVRDGVMQIPSGSMQVEPGERVVVYALPDAIPRVEKLCSAR